MRDRFVTGNAEPAGDVHSLPLGSRPARHALARSQIDVSAGQSPNSSAVRTPRMLSSNASNASVVSDGALLNIGFHISRLLIASRVASRPPGPGATATAGVTSLAIALANAVDASCGR